MPIFYSCLHQPAWQKRIQAYYYRTYIFCLNIWQKNIGKGTSQVISQCEMQIGS